MRTVIYPVHDLEAAKAVFGATLGVEPVMDQPYYVQYVVNGLEIGLDPHGHQKGMTGPVGYWEVDDIETSFKALLAAGATEQAPVKDVGNGRLIASATDADGNTIGLVQIP
jgi:predicted enzyme related to lactoylglutathione lyase